MTTVSDIFQGLCARVPGTPPPSAPGAPKSHPVPFNTAKAATMDTACISARAVANNTVLTIPAATDTAPSVSTTKPSTGFKHQLEKQLPGPHFLIPFTVPEPLRPFIRSHQRTAYQALFKASSAALKRLAKDARFIGTHLPGFTGVLHTWGKQLHITPTSTT